MLLRVRKVNHSKVAAFVRPCCVFVTIKVTLLYITVVKVLFVRAEIEKTGRTYHDEVIHTCK